MRAAVSGEMVALIVVYFAIFFVVYALGSMDESSKGMFKNVWGDRVF